MLTPLIIRVELSNDIFQHNNKVKKSYKVSVTERNKSPLFPKRFNNTRSYVITKLSLLISSDVISNLNVLGDLNNLGNLNWGYKNPREITKN